ncbi:maleylpyruvate isomerase family mycothiol-dependent enzyme [Streptomyces sp. A10(2020)]|uniref:maleylpyruvate isomerase family mycothiol-dependent enzyme n=1 Tax=Streptomyces sp. A10(2020) TaxID=2782013 RepID=UPI001F5DC7EE|nr:maleylpyruvate isomerase family mycothiol-dependent enzyme [Streptomyces sp. A10(2020)]UNR57746.1 maleylpyruvate isomerase family mycothiol-dependent enzyme [Streptomyces sp. A10(2020)]
MPAASARRPRSYDPVKTRAAVLAQAAHVAEAVRALRPDQLGAPSGLGDWSVAELVAHLATGVDGLRSGLVDPAPAAVEVALLDWAAGTGSRAEANARAARAAAEGQDPVERYTQATAEFARLLADVPLDRVIAARAGAMTFTDFLVTRAVELVVHSDDLRRATGVDIPLDRQALAAVVRVLADALAAKAPGGSVEVRVPPYAVVQCVAGPRHTRGTPPNVVETDPLTWVRLAAGRTGWAEAVDGGHLTAGGERADISALLPVLS